MTSSAVGDALRRFGVWWIFGAALAFRLFGLGAENLWLDEIKQVERASRPISDIVGITGDRDASLLSVALHHGVLQFGASEWALRLPSAVFGSLEVVAIFFLTRLLVGGRVALVASLLLATNPLHIWYSQEVRWYTLWSLLVTVSYLFLVRAWTTGSGRSWLGYVLSLVASSYTFVLTYFVMACQGLSTLWRGATKGTTLRAIRSLAMAQAVVVVLSLPVLMLVANHTAADSGTSVGTPRAVSMTSLPYGYYTYSAGFSAGPTVRELHFHPGILAVLTGHPIVLAYLFIALLAAIGIWRLRQESAAIQVVLPLVAGLPMLVFLASFRTDLVFNVRYTLPALTGWTIAVAAGVEHLWGRFEATRPRARWAFPAVLAVLIGYSLFNYYFNPTYDKEDSRSAFSAVREARRPDATVAVIGQIADTAEYYAGDLSLITFLQCEQTDDDGAWTYWSREPSSQPVELNPRELGAGSELWLVVGRDWDSEAEPCLAALSSSHREQDVSHFTGIDVYRLEPLDGQPTT